MSAWLVMDEKLNWNERVNYIEEENKQCLKPILYTVLDS